MDFKQALHVTTLSIMTRPQARALVVPNRSKTVSNTKTHPSMTAFVDSVKTVRTFLGRKSLGYFVQQDMRSGTAVYSCDLGSNIMNCKFGHRIRYIDNIWL